MTKMFLRRLSASMFATTLKIFHPEQGGADGDLSGGHHHADADAALDLDDNLCDDGLCDADADGVKVSKRTSKPPRAPLPSAEMVSFNSWKKKSKTEIPQAQSWSRCDSQLFASHATGSNEGA